MILSRTGRGYSKPAPGARINWGHPLAPAFAVLCNEGGGITYDLAGRHQLALAVGTSFAPGQFGRGLRCDGNDEGAFAAANGRLQHPTKATLFWRGTWVGTPTLNATVAQVTYTDADTAPFTAYGFYIGGANVFGAWNNGTFQDVDSTVPPTANLLTDFAFTIDGITARVYNNGRQVATDATGVGTISYANSRVTIGQHLVQSRNPNTLTDLLYIWPGRVLSPAEIMALHTQPYAPLLSQSPRLTYAPLVLYDYTTILM